MCEKIICEVEGKRYELVKGFKPRSCKGCAANKAKGETDASLCTALGWDCTNYLHHVWQEIKEDGN